MFDMIRRALDAPDDHLGWSHLRAELLSRYSGQPLPVVKHIAVESVMFPGRPAILARLEQGPLDSDDWKGLAASKQVLQVQIRALRNKGYNIQTEYRSRGQCTRYHLNA